jgi:hypothetical protein
MSRLRRAWPSMAAVSVYCLLGVLAYWPTSPVSSSLIPGCGCHDPAQEAWFLAWPAFAIPHLHSLFFTNWIGYPGGVNLASNTSMPLLGVLGSPVTALFGPVATYNLLLRVSFAASASAGYFVVRRWAPWPPAAFAGGLVYGFSPFMVGEGLGHVFLTFAPFPPLIFLCCERLAGGARNRVGVGIMLGLVCALQFFVSPEVLVTTELVAVIAVALVAVGRSGSLSKAGAAVRRTAPALLAGAGVLLVLTGYAVWEFLRGPQHIVGPSHSVAGLAPYHADLLSAIVPTQSERIAPWGLWAVGNRLTGFNVTETGAYIGIPLLLLLVVICVKCWDDLRVRLMAAMAVVCYVLSLGARLELDGLNTRIPLPFAVLEHVPVVQGASAGRFSLYTAFFVAVLLALGLQRARQAGGRQQWLALGVGAACLVPLLPTFPYQEVPTRVPTYFSTQAVDRVPAGSVVLAYPYPYTPDDQAMLWSATAGMRFRIIGGQAAIPGLRGRTTSAPKLLAPPVVEALFLDGMYGAPRVERSIPPPVPATLRNIREFLTRYDVGTIILEPVGLNPEMVVTYITAALGTPPTGEAGVEVWYDVPGLVRAAGGPADGKGSP